MQTAITKWEIEQLKYKESSTEWNELEAKIQKARSVEKQMQEVAKRLCALWKAHPAQRGEILSLAVSDDGYISLHCTDLIDYTRLSE